MQEYGGSRNTSCMEFKDRLKAARRHAKLGQVELAQLAGITQASIYDLERGKTKATSHVVKSADAFGVSAQWLSDDIGPALSSRSSVSPVTTVTTPEKTSRYPIISWVSAGAWAEAVEPYPPGLSDTYEFSEYDSKGPAFWLEVKGDSMTAPTGLCIAGGTLVLVDTRVEAAPGKLIVAKQPGSHETTFKKLASDGAKLFLKPLDGSYPSVAFAEDYRRGVAVRALQEF